MTTIDIEKIILDLQSKFNENLVSVYGIGSAFMSQLPSTSDVDLIVMLSNTDDCPRNDWSTFLFESVKINGTEIYYLYGTLDDYLDKQRFEKVSFANWEWAVRSLKFGSKFLWGKDIRSNLPEPDFSYDGIFLRSAYHLEFTSEYKLKDAELKGKPINAHMRFSKSIFKFGFLLLAIHYPSMNVFDKEGIHDQLKSAVKEGKIEKQSLEFYDMAMTYRKGKPFEDYENNRLRYMKLLIRETINGLGVSWDDVKSLLKKGFGSYPFQEIIDHVEKHGHSS